MFCFNTTPNQWLSMHIGIIHICFLEFFCLYIIITTVIIILIIKSLFQYKFIKIKIIMLPVYIYIIIFKN